MKETDITALVAKLHDIVRGVAQNSGGSIKAKDTSGYVHAFLVRKLFLGCLQYGSLKVDWSRTRVATIGEIVPDECMFLQHLPSTLSMAEASRFSFPGRIGVCSSQCLRAFGTTSSSRLGRSK